jgi:hypothetical protein
MNFKPLINNSTKKKEKKTQNLHKQSNQITIIALPSDPKRT